MRGVVVWWLEVCSYPGGKDLALLVHDEAGHCRGVGFAGMEERELTPLLPLRPSPFSLLHSQHPAEVSIM